MKTKVKRLSNRAIASLMVVLLVMSCFVVGTVSTVSAASIDPTDYGYRGNANNWKFNAFTRLNDTQVGYYTVSSNAGGFKVTKSSDGVNWNNANTLALDTSEDVGNGYSKKTTISTHDKGGSNINDTSKTYPHYICFVKESSNYYIWRTTTIPTSDNGTIYIRNTAAADDIRLYIYSPQLYTWDDSPYILKDGNVVSGGSNGWTVTSLSEPDGTQVLKVEGVYNAGNIIVRYGDSQSDDMVLKNGSAYNTAEGNSKTDNYKNKLATATVSHEKSGGSRIVSGDGSVQINSGSTSTTTATATVESGSSVTFTAIPDNGNDFAGWYSDEACTTLVDTNTTHTVSRMTSDTTLYAAFNKHYYLVGKFYFADVCKEHNESYSSTTYGFTQSSSNPALYTYENDFMFAYNSTLSQYNLQYVSVGYGGSKAYTTAVQNAPSGTAASGTDNNSVSWKWTCGDSTNGEYPPSALNNCYKHVKFTWNAITETLSWTVTDINMSDYVAMYVNCGSLTKEHLWLTGGDVLTPDGSDIYVPGTPFIVDSSSGSEVTYNVILVKNTTLGGTTLEAQLNNGSGSHGSNVGPMVASGIYSFDSSTSGAPTVYTPPVITKYDVNVTTTGTGGAAATSDAAKATENATVTITATPDAGKYTVISAVGDTSGERIAIKRVSSSSFTFTMPAENVSVSVSYADKVTNMVTTKSNDNTLGTAGSYTSNTPASAAAEINAEVDTLIHVFTNDVDGAIKKVTATGAGGSIDVTKVENGHYTFLMPPEKVTVNAVFGDAYVNFWYDGYQRKSSDEDNVLVKQDAANSGTNGKWADIDDLQFNEVKYEGHKYAYLQVTRPDHDPKGTEKKQEFTIRTTADGSSESGGGGGYFYFKYPNKQGDFQGNSATIHYYNSGGTEISSETMSFIHDGNDHKLFRSATTVPSGASYARVYHNASNASSYYADVTSAMLSAGGACCTTSRNGVVYYTYSWDPSAENPAVPELTSALSSYPKYGGTGGSATGATWLGSAGTDYNLNKGYTYITTGSQPKYGNNMALDFGFTNSNYPIHTEVVSPNSYYVIILYPDTDYGTLYPDTASVGSDTKYRVFLSKILPGESDPTINYYAKDGVIRDGSHKGLSESATTTVTKTDYVSEGSDNTAYGSSHYLTGTATKGHSITVTTTISESAKASDGKTLLRDKYYVAGFSFNGITPELLTPKGNDDPTNGVYSCTYNIREDFKGSTLEITPIFFLKDSTNTVTFYIDGYNNAVQEDWGHTLYIYPFYQVLNSNYEGQAENYRAYPGQPVICYGALRYTQIPVTDIGEAIGTTGTARVKGVTINNGFWDKIHRYVEGWSALDTADNNLDKSKHHQTYDYDDFYKIYNEYKNKGDKKLNSIYYTFKYKEEPTYTKHRTSYGTSSLNSYDLDKYYKDDLAATINPANYTDAEFLTDNYGRKVDLFGTVLSSSQISTNAGNELYVISQGYEYNNAGAYGTEWTVYHNDSDTYRKVTVAGGKTMIVPSALVIANADDVSDTDYPGLDGDKAVKDYKAIYEALEDYRGIPVKISYEVSLEGGAKPKNTYDQAFRADGRWTYTKTTDNITGNVKIEYINEKEGTNDWTVDAFTTDTNVGSHTGVSAYFEYISAAKNGYGAASDGATSITALVQDEKFFSMRAETSGSYEFQGWYSLDANGDYHPVNVANVTSKTAESAMARNATFVARFKYVASGSLTISHQLLTGNAGRGTTYIGVSVNGTVIADVASNTDSVTLDKTYIGSNKGANEITVTLKTVPSGENTFNAFSAKKIDDEATPSAIADAATFFTGANSPASGYAIGTEVTREITFTVANLYESAVQKVMALSYYSELDQPTNTYEIKYQYAGRHGASSDMKAYTVTGTFTSSQLKAYITSGTGTSKVVDNQFYADMVPDESNFKKTITWNTDSPTSPTWTSVTGGYKLTATVTSTTTDDVSAHAVFSVPYEVDTAANGRAAKVSDRTGTVLKLAENGKTSFEVDTVYGKWFDPVTTCTSNTKLSESTKFVSAPAMIYEEYVEDEVTKYRPYYFSYWKVSSLTKTGKAGKFITNVYYADFYHISYENYYIEAIYSTNANQAASALATTNNGKNLDATISFLQDSRNQWNNDGHGDLTGVGGDIIWNDFAASFKYNGETLNDVAGDTKNIRTGFVFERVGKAEMSGDEHVGTLEGYEETYKSTVETSISAIKTKLKENPNFTTLATNPGQAAYYASNKPFAANYEGSGAPNSLSDTTKIDNKNRCEYGYSMYNSYNASGSAYAVGTTYKNKTYVFRAFAYIMVKNGETWDVAVSAEPAYFCMYDTASKK